MRDCKNQFRCHGTSICLPLDLVCDGVQNCPQGDDELMCHIHCPPNCLCHDLSVSCHNISSTQSIQNLKIFSRLRKLDLSNNFLDLNLTVFDGCYYLVELILSNCGITDIRPYLFSYLNNLIHLDISYNRIRTLSAGTFLGLSRLKTIILIGNPIETVQAGAFSDLIGIHELDISGARLKFLYPGVFQGLLNLDNLNLSFNQIESVADNSFQYLSKLTLLDLQGNKIMTFGNGIFNYLDALNALFTDSFTFCCVRPSGMPDTNCYPPKDEFSSCEDLMREDVLRAFLWIIGLIAFIGNITVLSIRFYVQRSATVLTHRVFVTNLSFADLMMGIYLIVLAVADATFRGQYAWKDYHWRHGIVCNLAGMLSLVASEGSVVFLFMITLDRLLVVKFPFGKIRISHKAAIIICLVSWLILCCIALVPIVLSSYFNNMFYSRSAVCLALPLTSERPPGWEYSFAVFIVFNFGIFVLIAAAQIAIYLEIVSSSSRIRSTKRRQDITIARNLFLVAFTNFVCVFPIGVMGELS